jgi:hypothetical protein
MKKPGKITDPSILIFYVKIKGKSEKKLQFEKLKVSEWENFFQININEI